MATLQKIEAWIQEMEASVKYRTSQVYALEVDDLRARLQSVFTDRPEHHSTDTPAHYLAHCKEQALLRHVAKLGLKI